MPKTVQGVTEANKDICQITLAKRLPRHCRGKYYFLASPMTIIFQTTFELKFESVLDEIGSKTVCKYEERDQ